MPHYTHTALTLHYPHLDVNVWNTGVAMHIYDMEPPGSGQGQFCIGSYSNACPRVILTAGLAVPAGHLIGFIVRAEAA